MKALETKFIATLLQEELTMALGCTEPIAIAYCCAKAKVVLGSFPTSLIIRCSGNIVKNVKGVVIPNTQGLKGIKVAALMGIVCGKADQLLEVIAQCSEEERLKVTELMRGGYCKVELIEAEANLQIEAIVSNGEEKAFVQIKNTHTNITKIMKNNQVLFEQPCESKEAMPYSDRSILSVDNIYNYIENEDYSALYPLLEKQIECNMAIAQEGMKTPYGAQVGRILMETNTDSIMNKVIAYAAAGSDARMSGCSLPVVVNSGSGNQGMTTSIPVIMYAKEHQISHEKTLKALALSNLITIHLKTGIGRLSAYCGVVSAASGAMSAITYLAGGSLKQIEKTITNCGGTISGMVCDGAKPSCAAKIASALSCGAIAHQMAMRNIVFEQNTGIIQNNIEHTIDAFGVLGRIGMKETDEVILKMMIENDSSQ